MPILDDSCAVAIESYDIYSRSAEAIISSQRPLDFSEAIHRTFRSTFYCGYADETFIGLQEGLKLLFWCKPCGDEPISLAGAI
jgi:hypothetical protein